LYDFGGEYVINFIKNLDENYQNVMIFGHNHAFTSICNIFGDMFVDNLPTSGLMVIDFSIDSWKDVNKGKTRFTIFPRDLK
jgi:phosphohistidine phosphatase